MNLKIMSLVKSLLHNLLVLVVGFAVALLGTKIDAWLAMPRFMSVPATIAGCLCLAAGFLIRVWSACLFYAHSMKVISLEAQNTLLTSGPYAFSRNPLYLGGNVFIFLGASLLLGSPSGIGITLLHLPLIDLFIRREERQLEEKFGQQWRDYKARVRRWI